MLLQFLEIPRIFHQNPVEKRRNSLETNIPALRAKGLHRGELNTRARSALVIRGDGGERFWLMRGR